MSRKIKTLLSRILLSTFIFLLVTPAFAMYTYEENALPTLTEEKYNIVLYVTESCALLLDEHSQQTHNTDPSGASISFPWGVSVSGIGSQGISCKTTLTAVLYK